MLQDVTTLYGSQFCDAAVIVASPPCQAYSYRAMPWSRAKALPPPDNTLSETCFRIQREASEAAGRYIPLIVENVKGAQKWVGRARWHFGSFYLWGDVPALMPPIASPKVAGQITIRNGYSHTRHLTNPREHLKVPGIKLSEVGFNVAAAQRYREGVKFSQSGDAWFDGKPRDKMLGDRGPVAFGSKSNSRKAASAKIAKIPFPLAQHIARCFYPREVNGPDAETIASGKQDPGVLE